MGCDARETSAGEDAEAEHSVQRLPSAVVAVVLRLCCPRLLPSQHRRIEQLSQSLTRTCSAALAAGSRGLHP